MRAAGRIEERREVKNKLVAVAIDKDKGSQSALKWATDHLLNRGQTVILVHVNNKNNTFSNLPLSPSLSGSGFSVTSDLSDENGSMYSDLSPYTRELFLPFRCFCTRKYIQCQDVVLDDTDVVKALFDYVKERAIEVLVLGAPSKNSFLRRFKAVDIPGSILKGVPDFCTVYVISKGKISSTRAAARTAPSVSNLRNQTPFQSTLIASEQLPQHTRAPILPSRPTKYMHNNTNIIKSPLTHKMGPNGKPFVELSIPERAMSFANSSGRPSVERGISSPEDLSSSYDLDSQSCYDLLQLGPTPPRFSAASLETDNLCPSPIDDDVETEMRRLKIELKQTVDMYSTAYREALTAKEMADELQRWKIEEEQRLKEARLAEEAALEIIEKEKEKSKAAIKAAEAAQRIAQLEEQKRIKTEMKALKEAEEKDIAINRFGQSDSRCRRYTIKEIDDATNFFSKSLKIGEGGYGPVYKCYLDHTPVAIKVLRPDAAHGRSQFQQEVHVLSCIRHPNMVLLVGSCPEYGCLVYEYMSNGSLEDCLFHHQVGKRLPLTWKQRLRIATEITRGLVFLHQTKPEPLVHRDLKPANILLDRNYVGKISDVGLSRLVPPSIGDAVTQYRMTSTAGTFCYVDPEYQKTGMLGVKSDIYALGIIFLQLITAKPPMGLTHQIAQAIEDGTLSMILDPTVPDWTLDETTMFAKMALKCSEMRRKDRPDLGKVVLPELEILSALADKTTMFDKVNAHGTIAKFPDDMSYSMQSQSVSSKSRSSISGWHV